MVARPYRREGVRCRVNFFAATSTLVTYGIPSSKTNAPFVVSMGVQTWHCQRADKIMGVLEGRSESVKLFVHCSHHQKICRTRRPLILFWHRLWPDRMLKSVRKLTPEICGHMELLASLAYLLILRRRRYAALAAKQISTRHRKISPSKALSWSTRPSQE